MNISVLSLHREIVNPGGFCYYFCSFGKDKVNVVMSNKNSEVHSVKHLKGKK